MTKQYDAIVIGGGHNGLVCAAYLGKAGKKVLLLEAADEVGGMARTREFCEGYRVSAGAHILHSLSAQVVKELALLDHGLDRSGHCLETVILDEQGAHVTAGRDSASGEGLSPEEIEAYASFKKKLRSYAELMQPMMRRRPPRVAALGFRDSVALAKLGWNMRFGLGTEEMRDFLRLAGINIYDVLDEFLGEGPASDKLKGMISLDAVMGSFTGPRSPNTVFTYLCRLMGELEGDMQLPVGGMGAVMQALANAAQAHGVEVRTAAPVSSIRTEKGCVVGVRLASGDDIDADIVVSNADPKTTFLKLLGAPKLEAGFANRVSRIRNRGTAAKLHFALRGLPKFTGLEEGQLRNRLLVASSSDFVELAFNPVKYEEVSDSPAIELVIPSLADPSLAPEGHHVMSIALPHVPYALKGGWDAEARKAFIDSVIASVERFAPGFTELVVDSELLTPADIEAQFGATGGHWHHGELALDQMLMLRPLYGAAQYTTPLDGLFLCGAGCHPGGGVSGLPGHNAAAAVLKNKKKGRAEAVA
ncbi:phytoene desaturase family protein [Biformimicrobium ophioploci]|uniref:Pyridine nucleotide-disulfide oxidoreductase domain-containing protein 2 n=1 Tax=Biformimicrobium ophioploci TaxID=3036711 RepID=A0ABQ6M2B8_9GAMM|nr:NAD(P)/FAD-dependent oxidoreductase [Microbulbifer sp. NKW57]GMG88473.1 NAD(P)/FAD-dependent oxidoreductase [Microbulbifer sp. NKW57]